MSPIDWLLVKVLHRGPPEPLDSRRDELDELKEQSRMFAQELDALDARRIERLRAQARALRSRHAQR